VRARPARPSCEDLLLSLQDAVVRKNSSIHDESAADPKPDPGCLRISDPRPPPRDFGLRLLDRESQARHGTDVEDASGKGRASSSGHHVQGIAIPAPGRGKKPYSKVGDGDERAVEAEDAKFLVVLVLVSSARGDLVTRDHDGARLPSGRLR